jgi:hypothetical protein
LKVRFTPEAESRAIAVATWWRKNGIVRDLFDRELAEAQEKVIADPILGGIYRTVRGVIIRRILLPKTAQHFYYSVDEKAEEILVKYSSTSRRAASLRDSSSTFARAARTSNGTPVASSTARMNRSTVSLRGFGRAPAPAPGADFWPCG